MQKEKQGQHISKFIGDECRIQNKEIRIFLHLIQRQQSHFQDITYLGNGIVSVTLKAFNSKEQRSVALKIYQCNREQSNSTEKKIGIHFQKQFELLQQFSFSDNIVKFHSSFFLYQENQTSENNDDIIQQEKMFFVIEMEYQECNLSQYFQQIRQSKLLLNEKLKEQMVIKMIDAVNTIHQLNVIHGCIKPSKFLISTNQNEIQVKLCDFGLIASQIQLKQLITSKKNENYISFEQQKGLYLKQADIFSLGLIILELDNINTFDISKISHEQKFSLYQGVDKLQLNRTSNLYLIAQLCLIADYRQRPSATELLEVLIGQNQQISPNIYSLILQNQVDNLVNSLLNNQYLNLRINKQYLISILLELCKKQGYKGYLEFISIENNELVLGARNYIKKRQSIIQIQFDKENKDIQDQFQIREYIKAPLIVELIGYFQIQVEQKQLIVQEFERCSCTLSEFLQRQIVQQEYSNELKLHLSFQVIDIVNYLHQFNILLGDLTPESFQILENPENGQNPFVKLSNLSFAIKLGDQKTIENKKVQKNMYLAPECYSQIEPIYTKQSDCFSVGLILCMIDNFLQLKPIFNAIYEQVTQPFDIPFQNNSEADFINRNSQIYQIIKELVVYEPNNRKSLSSIISYLPYQSYSSQLIQKQEQNISQSINQENIYNTPIKKKIHEEKQQSEKQNSQSILKSSKKQSKFVQQYEGKEVQIKIYDKSKKVITMDIQKTLESVQINFENLEIQDLGNMWECLVQCRQLYNLSINLNQTFLTFEVFEDMQDAFRWWFTNLQYFCLDFEYNKADDQIMQNISQSIVHSNNLQYLKLYFSTNSITDQGFASLCKSLENFRQLKEIAFDFTSNFLTDKSLFGFQNIIKENGNLQKLQLNFMNNQIEGQSLQIFKLLKTTQNFQILDFDFSGNKSTREGFLGVCEALKSKNLNEVNLNFNNTDLSEKSLLDLCYYFSDTYKLQSVQLRLCQNEVTELVLLTLAKVFYSLHDIEQIILSLRKNKIQDKGFLEVCQQFKTLSKLKHLQLNFGYNLITLEGFQQSVKELTQCQMLQSLTLDLTMNSLSIFNTSSYVKEAEQTMKNKFKNIRLQISL